MGEASDDTLVVDDVVKRYLESVQNTIQSNRISGLDYYEISFPDLAEFSVELAEMLLDKPEEILRTMEIFIRDILQEPVGDRFKFRVTGLSEKLSYQGGSTLEIRRIREEHKNKMFRIVGNVRSKSQIFTERYWSKWSCPSCGNEVICATQKQTTPRTCVCGRRGGFVMVEERNVDLQVMALEEDYDILEYDQPKKIFVMLKGGLTAFGIEQKTTPGTKVEVVGIVKEKKVVVKDDKNIVRYEFFVEANNLRPLKEDNFGKNLSQEEILSINKFSQSESLFEKLCSYIAPSIYGHDNIKLAILLQMTGGVAKHTVEGLRRRGNIHILVVGDPGAGKTVLCQSVTKLLYKSRFVSGKGASGVGITAAVVKDELIGKFSLEAGAMVLANKSVLVVDEIEKMREEDRSNLHTAMEQGIIPINKASIQATLNAETSILAIGNPRRGKFNRFDELYLQIDLSASLLSRFDLIFMVLQSDDRVYDENMLSHLFRVHTGEKMAVDDSGIKFFRKYIAYCKNVSPRMTVKAHNVLSEYFMRAKHNSYEGEEKVVGLTGRQFESMIRLSEASAKIRLSEDVEEQDALRAIGLLSFYLKSFGYDAETGKIDVGRITQNMSESKRSKIEHLLEFVSKVKDSPTSYEDILQVMQEYDLGEVELDKILAKLCTDGSLFCPNPGRYVRT